MIRIYALFRKINWLHKKTQPKKYDALCAQDSPNSDAKIVDLVADNISKSKLETLQVLREKVKDREQYLDLVYFKPSHSKTPEHMEGYLKNKLTVIRQLKYSKKNEMSIDIVLFLNGLPVVTMELKNALTGQYMHDSLLDLIQNYVNFQVNKEKYYNNQTKALREKEKTVLIFPRFHQCRAVQNSLDAVRKESVGNKYLIQLSSGSGKSNTIS